MFKKTQEKKSLKVKSGKDLAGLNKLVRPGQLLALDRRAKVIQSFLGFLSFSPERYEKLAESLLKNVTSYMAELPETRNSYFSNRGGFLDHAISRTEAALQLARDYFVDDEGQQTKELSEPQKLWMYTLFSAAMLRGIGRLLTDFDIDIYYPNGGYQAKYQPLDKALLSYLGCYDYNFAEPEPDVFIRRSTIMLAKKIMPEEGLLWIASKKQVFAVWLALLDENEHDAGVFGHLLDTADAMAILKYLNERALARYGERKSVQSTTFVTPSDDLPLKEGELPPAGVEFIKWFAQKLAAREIMINKAPLLMVPGGLLMNQDIFKLFVRESPLFKNWLNVQKAVMQLGLHQVLADGATTQRFMDTKTRKLHSGIVISSLGAILPEKMAMINAANGVIKDVTRSQVIRSKNTNSSLRSVATNMPMFNAINASGEQIIVSALADGPTNAKGG